jgi:hypothetical protein
VSITDPAWRGAVDHALAIKGELTALLAYPSAGGLRHWFLIQDPDELESVLRQASVHNGTQLSTMIALLATPEFPHRGTDPGELRAVAKEIAASSWVVVAQRRDGDPRLYDEFAADDPAELDSWFDQPRDGIIVVGEDPYARDRSAWPDGQEFVAFGPGADGGIRPGAY